MGLFNNKDGINFNVDEIGILIVLIGLFIVIPICLTFAKIFG